jgi:uncharacterized protein (TIGR03067 family)
MRLASLLAFTGLCCQAIALRGDDAVIASSILGSWSCVSAVNNGKPLDEAKANVLRMTLTADRYKTELGQQVLFDSTYKLDASKTPATIDIIGAEGDLKGKAALGILKLDGQTMTMCYVMPGQDRPVAFDSQPGSAATLVVWKKLTNQ